MEGFVKSCANQQLRRFALLLLFAVALSFLGGYGIASISGKQAARVCLNSNLALIGQIAEALPEQSDVIAHAVVSNGDAADQARGSRLLEHYGLTEDIA